MHHICRVGPILLYLFLNSFPMVAQTGRAVTGNWFMVFNQTRLNDKWSIHSEVQYRSFELLPNTEQLLLRTGINFHFNQNFSSTLGYAYIPNYAMDKEVNKGVQVTENRMWQQVLLKHPIGRVNFEHRYRLEQRWLQTKLGDRFLSRVRYLLRATIPLNKKTIEKKAIFISFYNEVFIHFSSTPFDRNRLYGAVGYQFSPNSNFQLGYLAQTVNNLTKQYLQAGIFYNFDFRSRK